MTMDDLVYVQIACTDLAYYDKFNAAYKTYFSKTNEPNTAMSIRGSIFIQ